MTTALHVCPAALANHAAVGFVRRQDPPSRANRFYSNLPYNSYNATTSRGPSEYKSANRMLEGCAFVGQSVRGPAGIDEWLLAASKTGRKERRTPLHYSGVHSPHKRSPHGLAEASAALNQSSFAACEGGGSSIDRASSSGRCLSQCFQGFDRSACRSWGFANTGCCHAADSQTGGFFNAKLRGGPFPALPGASRCRRTGPGSKASWLTRAAGNDENGGAPPEPEDGAEEFSVPEDFKFDWEKKEQEDEFAKLERQREARRQVGCSQFCALHSSRKSDGEIAELESLQCWNCIQFCCVKTFALHKQ